MPGVAEGDPVARAPHPMHLHLAPALLLVSPFALAASDVEHRIRFGFDSLPTEADAEIGVSSGALGGSATGEVEFERSGRMTLAYSARIGGQAALVVGGGIALAGSEFADYEGEISEAGVLGEIGLGVRLAPWFDLEAVVPLGFGGARLEAGGEEADGSYAEAGLLLRPVFTIGERLQAWAHVGVEARRLRFEDDDDGYDLTLDLEQDGVVAGLGLGIVL